MKQYNTEITHFHARHSCPDSKKIVCTDWTLEDNLIEIAENIIRCQIGELTLFKAFQDLEVEHNKLQKKLKYSIIGGIIIAVILIYI